MGPLRGLKRDIWEGGHRIPLVVRWPGVVAPGAVSSALVSQIDLMATIAAVVDYQLPPEAAEDSHDLLPLWQGQTTVGRHSMAHNTYKDHYAVRADDWVLIDAPSGHVTKVPAWFDEQNQYEANPYPAALYHIREDLGEHHNLFATRPEKVAELRELLQRIRAHGEVRPGPG
jgi:arylsulfatase A